MTATPAQRGGSGRLLLKFLLGLALFGTGGLVGYYGRGVESYALSMGKPLVLRDISDTDLRKFGAPFDRPEGARAVAVAALGNGVGDVVTYARLELPPAQAQALYESLQTQGFALAERPPNLAYLDKVPPAVADSLWPKHQVSAAQTLRRHGVYVAHVAAQGSLHVYSVGGGTPE